MMNLHVSESEYQETYRAYRAEHAEASVCELFNFFEIEMMMLALCASTEIRSHQVQCLEGH